MISYDAERLSEVREEMGSLIQDHWEEIALDQEKIPLDVDWNTYELLEKNNQLAFVTVRNDRNLVGYAAWFIRPHLHYKTTTFAYNDVIFLKKEYRKGRIGLGLIKASEYLCKILGADKIWWHVKVTNDWTKILERMGYVKEEWTLGKYVGE